MVWKLASASALLLSLALFGCANLEAKKVPLAKRLAGTDDRIHGFRYYLSRPYVVVSERICVGQHVMSGPLFHAPALGDPTGSQEVYLLTLDENGCETYVDARGQWLDGKPIGLSPLTIPAPRAASAQPGRPGISVEGGSKPATKPGKSGNSVGGNSTSSTKPKTSTADPSADPAQPAAEASRPPSPTPVTINNFAGCTSQGDPVSQRDPQFEITNLTRAELMELLGSKGCPSPNAFQFVMLPDFEEQMAVKDRNVAAYGKYEMHFGDGWQLTSVSGTWDATQVAVKALQVLSNAISVSDGERKEQAAKAPTGVGDRGGENGDRGSVPVWGVRVESIYIEPGIYRIQKSVERTEGVPYLGEHGLLSQFGFKLVSEVKLVAVKPE